MCWNLSIEVAYERMSNKTNCRWYSFKCLWDENMFIGFGGHVKWMIFMEQFEATQQASCKSLRWI